MDLADLHRIEDLQLRCLEQEEVQAMDPPVPFHDLDSTGEKRFEFPAGNDLDLVDLPALLEVRTEEFIAIIIQRAIRNGLTNPRGLSWSANALTLLL
jgi:hypothetical protein